MLFNTPPNKYKTTRKCFAHTMLHTQISHMASHSHLVSNEHFRSPPQTNTVQRRRSHRSSQRHKADIYIQTSCHEGSRSTLCPERICQRCLMTIVVLKHQESSTRKRFADKTKIRKIYRDCNAEFSELFSVCEIKSIRRLRRCVTIAV